MMPPGVTLARNTPPRARYTEDMVVTLWEGAPWSREWRDGESRRDSERRGGGGGSAGSEARGGGGTRPARPVGGTVAVPTWA